MSDRELEARASKYAEKECMGNPSAYQDIEVAYRKGALEERKLGAEREKILLAALEEMTGVRLGVAQMRSIGNRALERYEALKGRANEA